MAQFVQKNGLEIILRLFVRKSKILEAYNSEYTHPNIFWTTFLELESQNKSILKKSGVTHVPGRFFKKWTQRYGRTDGQTDGRTDGRTSRFRPGLMEKIFFFLIIIIIFIFLFFMRIHFLKYKRFAINFYG
jgi:hypothetical protein